MTALAKLKSPVTMPRMSGGNVASIRNYKVQDVYKSFLGIHGNNSEKTAIEYDKRVREFFRLTLDKDIEYVILEDIQSITKSDVQNEYIDMLIAKGNQGNTIKTKLNSIRSFYNELLSNNLSVNPLIFKIKISTDVKHVNALSFDELQDLFNFMKSEKQLGLEKYLLVKTLFTTGNRRSATFSMKWDENFIIKRDVNTGEDIHVIRVKDKGNKWIEKPISDDYYEELQQLNLGQEKVFNFAERTMERALERFSKELGKKITMHSMKATAITLGYQMTKDINLCKQLGGHSSIVTTEIYLRDEQSLVNQLSYTMSKDYNESVIYDLTHEELLEFIEDNDDIKRLMVMRLSE